MSPERQAEAEIDAAIDAHRDCDPLIIARVAVERIAAAGLVVLTAARAQQLLEIERTALAVAQSEDQMATLLRGEALPAEIDPWPEADAMVRALLDNREHREWPSA